MVDKLHNFRLMLLIIFIPVLFSCATTQQNKVESKDADAYCNRGMAYMNKGQYDQAILDYNKAIEIDPKDGKAYENRGKCYHGNQEYGKSWEDFKKAQDLGGQYPPQFLDELFRKASGTQK